MKIWNVDEVDSSINKLFFKKSHLWGAGWGLGWLENGRFRLLGVVTTGVKMAAGGHFLGE